MDLLFAYGLAKLGEAQASAKLVEAARAAVEKIPAENKVGIGSRFLFKAFKHRVDQAAAGQSLAGRLPPVQVELAPPVPSVGELSADELADIPDIAMPDADATPHRAGTTTMPQATLQVVHGIG